MLALLRRRVALHLAGIVCFFLHLARVCTMIDEQLCIWWLLALLAGQTVLTVCTVDIVRTVHCVLHCSLMFADLRFSCAGTSLPANSLICWLLFLFVYARLLTVDVVCCHALQ